MTSTPHQRPCGDRRTVLLLDTSGLGEVVRRARADGWSVWSARRDPDGLRLTLARS